MNNWIGTIACNGGEMTKAAIDSFDKQDLDDVRIYLLKNACSRDDFGWYDDIRQRPSSVHILNNRVSVSFAWNTLIRDTFSKGSDHVLVCNNDIELHPSTYRLLLADGGDFVTPVGTRDRDSVMGEHVTEADFRPNDRRPHPDFSCFLIRRAAWEAVGPFDERFEGAYCEDGDYHLRLHQAGIDAYSIGVPFYHRVSGTIANDPAGAAEIHRKADANRRRFREKWGFAQGSPEYYRFFETKQVGSCQTSR